MRRVRRLELPAAACRYLNRRREATKDKASVEREWKAARQTQAMGLVLKALRSMAGKRERCMYCVDSHGGDIEHFWPKGPYPGKAFVWPNLLLCCTECGRFKGERFPLSAAGMPLLVDPSSEDPWEFLDFDPETGNVTARFDAVSGDPLVRGECTVRVLRLDRREGMAEAYRRTFLRLKRVVENALASPDPIDVPKLIADLRHFDDHGLLGWCFSGTGANVKPFADLRSDKPAVWAECEAASK